MATGIKVPLRAINGRLEKLGGDAYIEQLIMTGLGDCQSENPFQDIGLGEFMIFGINDDRSTSDIRTRIAQVFALLEADQLAKLERLTFEEEDGHEKKAHLTYVNIETQERHEIEVPIPE